MSLDIFRKLYPDFEDHALKYRESWANFIYGFFNDDTLSQTIYVCLADLDSTRIKNPKYFYSSLHSTDEELSEKYWDILFHDKGLYSKLGPFTFIYSKTGKRIGYFHPVNPETPMQFLANLQIASRLILEHREFQVPVFKALYPVFKDRPRLLLYLTSQLEGNGPEFKTRGSLDYGHHAWNKYLSYDRFMKADPNISSGLKLEISLRYRPCNEIWGEDKGIVSHLRKQKTTTIQATKGLFNDTLLATNKIKDANIVTLQNLVDTFGDTSGN